MIALPAHDQAVRRLIEAGMLVQIYNVTYAATMMGRIRNLDALSAENPIHVPTIRRRMKQNIVKSSERRVLGLAWYLLKWLENYRPLAAEVGL